MKTLPDNIADLSTLVIQAPARMKALAVADCPDPFIVIKGQEAAKRAIIVAAVQMHSILFVGPPHTSKTMLCRAAAAVGCPAKEFQIVPPTDVPTRAQRAKFQKRLVEALKGINLFVEVPAVPTRTLLNPQHGTDLPTIQQYLAGATTLPPKNPEMLDDNSKSLLRQAMAEWRLGPECIENILTVAQSIAALEQTDSITMVHVAEAVQYDPARYAAEPF